MGGSRSIHLKHHKYIFFLREDCLLFLLHLIFYDNSNHNTSYLSLVLIVPLNSAFFFFAFSPLSFFLTPTCPVVISLLYLFFSPLDFYLSGWCLFYFLMFLLLFIPLNKQTFATSKYYYPLLLQFSSRALFVFPIYIFLFFHYYSSAIWLFIILSKSYFLTSEL